MPQRSIAASRLLLKPPTRPLRRSLGALGQVQARLEGTEAGEYAEQAKDFVDKNPIGAVAALGGLAALLLGTKGGRAVTGGAAKLGGLAAIGGIAYKALRNYQEGKPLTQGVPGLEQLTAAPEGTSFSELAHTNDTALLLIRTMVATAAADGVIEPSQRAAIIGQLKGGGLNPEAAQFLDAEIQHPATVSEISAAVGSSKDLASQVYAAAHLIASSPQEKAFIENLAKALALDPGLVAHIPMRWRRRHIDLEVKRRRSGASRVKRRVAGNGSANFTTTGAFRYRSLTPNLRKVHSTSLLPAKPGQLE